MLSCHNTRFFYGSGVGFINWPRRKHLVKAYSNSVKTPYENSLQDALDLYEKIDCFEDLDGINILSVARRGWRKDTKDTSVAAISDQSRKMPNWIHVTKRPRFPTT